MLISKVLHVSVIAPCVEEPVRTEVAHDLEDGHAAVLDLRRIGLPGLGPPLPRCGSWCSAWSSCEDSCRSHSDGTFEPALGCGVRSLEVTVELGVGAREGPVGGVSGHVGGSHRSRSHEALHVAHTTAGGCGGRTIHDEGSAPLLRASSAGARSRSTFEASVGRSRGAPPPHSKGSSGRPPPSAGGASATMIATRMIRRCQCRHHYCCRWPTTTLRGTHAAGAGCATVAAENDDNDDAAGGEADVEVKVVE